MVKSIPSEQVTHGSPVVLPLGHEDTLWLNPREFIIGGVLEDDYYRTSPFIGTEKFSKTSGQGEKDEEDGLDKVDLTDIESISYTKYFDAVTKATKYKAVIKIRNSSSDKLNVRGVDARIYNPGEE
jgi:hypothetical protein